MLPGSIFATKGARAMGDAGRMPDDHKEVAGLQIAYVARDALTAHLRCPVFGRITTLNRKRGGGKPERGAALVHNIFHVPERPDIMALAITWLIGRDELPKYYPFPQFPQGDPEFTGKAYKAMAPHECILDTTWRELSAFSTFEPSIKVFRSTSAESYEMYQNDPDVIILTSSWVSSSMMFSPRTQASDRTNHLRARDFVLARRQHEVVGRKGPRPMDARRVDLFYALLELLGGEQLPNQHGLRECSQVVRAQGASSTGNRRSVQ